MRSLEDSMIIAKYDNLQEQLEDISPCGLVEMIDEDKSIN